MSDMQMEKLYPAPGHQTRERFERDNHYPAVRALRELPDELQNDVLHTYEQRRKKLLWAYMSGTSFGHELWAVEGDGVSGRILSPAFGGILGSSRRVGAG